MNTEQTSKNIFMHKIANIKNCFNCLSRTRTAIIEKKVNLVCSVVCLSNTLSPIWKTCSRLRVKATDKSNTHFKVENENIRLKCGAIQGMCSKLTLNSSRKPQM